MNRSFTLILCLLSGTVATSLPAEQPPNDVDALRVHIRQLESENKSLRAESLRLKDNQPVAASPASRKRLIRDLDRLQTIRKAIESNSFPPSQHSEALALAVRVAHSQTFSPLIWHVLLDLGALKNGLSIEDAESLLGSTTSEDENWAVWYYNPHNRHVAPALMAKIGKNGLSDWKINLH